ncbi:MAG TPA: hypothetical protein PK431_08540 [Chitinophagales bacterium]|nr:hypothetical protein [Chitinophagales bacterium]
MEKIFSILLVTIGLNFTTYATENLKIISTVVGVETDYISEGVKGIKLTYRYNFLPLEEQNHNDTILSKASFSISAILYENNNAIEPALGYKSIANENGDAAFGFDFLSNEMQASKFDKKKSLFIPYAALKLSEGNHVISIKTLFSGTDGTGIKHEQKLLNENVNFSKPKTNTFTLNIDYIEVTEKNAKGNVWDIAFFRTDAPDVGVNVLVGNISVWKKNVNDTYMFAVGPNSKNITFTISENDRVELLIQDIDVLFHDFIARLAFETKKIKTNQIYNYNTESGNVKSCSLNFKID